MAQFNQPQYRVVLQEGTTIYSGRNSICDVIYRIPAPHHVRTRRGLPNAAKQIWGFIARSELLTGECRLSAEELAIEAEIPQEKARAYLRRMVKAGLLEYKQASELKPSPLRLSAEQLGADLTPEDRQSLCTAQEMLQEGWFDAVYLDFHTEDGEEPTIEQIAKSAGLSVRAARRLLEDLKDQARVERMLHLLRQPV